MADSLVYVTFKDSVDRDDPVNYQLAVDNVIMQLISAADRIKADPQAIYLYLRTDARAAAVDKQKELVKSVQKNTSTEDELLERIFKSLKRTSKSVKILTIFAHNSGSELSIQEIADMIGLPYADVAAWLCTTAKSIPAITSPARGIYKFDPDKL